MTKIIIRSRHCAPEIDLGLAPPQKAATKVVTNRPTAVNTRTVPNSWLLRKSRGVRMATVYRNTMTLDHETTQLRGLLVGNGFKVLCVVQAKHTKDVGTQSPVRTAYTILETAEPLPDGRYWLAVNSQTFDADYKNEGWLVHH